MDPTATPTMTPTAEAPHAPAPDRVRIVSTPGIRGGKPRIDGHRITVEDVAVWHERMGMSPDEIASAYPSITLTDVYAALAYYHENRRQINAAIEEGQRFVEEMKAKASPSPLQQKLKQRQVDGKDDPLPPG